MSSFAARDHWLRRARPLLGTLVEVGVHADTTAPQDAADAAFATVAEVQRCLSRFEVESDVTRFHALKAGTSLAPRAHTLEVLTTAQALHEASGGVFDITLGTAPQGWRCDGSRWHNLSDDAQIDLGGIAKGYAVDCAVAALMARGCEAGWVNAGGDLRVFGHAELPLTLRDEAGGGVRFFATLREGAFATSHFGAHSRSQAWSAVRVRAHVSVAAPLCLWADALTKLVAVTGNIMHPLLLRFEAQAWLH